MQSSHFHCCHTLGKIFTELSTMTLFLVSHQQFGYQCVCEARNLFLPQVVKCFSGRESSIGPAVFVTKECLRFVVPYNICFFAHIHIEQRREQLSILKNVGRRQNIYTTLNSVQKR